MPFYTGSANTPDDLLNQIRTHCVANGYTETIYRTDGTGHRLVLTKGGMNYIFRSATVEGLASEHDGSATTGIALSAADNYNDTLKFNQQLRSPVNTNGNKHIFVRLNVTFPVASFELTINTDFVFLSVPQADDWYHFLALGVMQIKYGDWTGGEFIAGSHSVVNDARRFTRMPLTLSGGSNILIRFTDGAATGDVNQWAGCGSSGDLVPSNRLRGLDHREKRRLLATPNASNGLHVYLPIIVEYFENGYIPLGELPYLLSVNTDGMVSGNDYTDIPGKTYRFYPWAKRSDSFGMINNVWHTGKYGVMVEKT